jgi:hypothetical protein
MVPYMSGEDLKNSHMPDIVKFGLHDWVAYISRFCVNYMPFKTFSIFVYLGCSFVLYKFYPDSPLPRT